MNEHYFSAESATDDARRTLSVVLEGQKRDVVSARSVFSGDRLDRATDVFLRRLDEITVPPPGATIVDLGCGWGPIALSAALRHPDAQVWAVDVSSRARDLTAENAELLGLSNVLVVSPEDVPYDLSVDALWSNPPIRIGKEALHELLQLWLGRLAPTGTAAMVVGKNLGADPLMRWMQNQVPDRAVSKAASAKGFRIIEVGPSHA